MIYGAHLALFVVCLVAAAFFSASETALMSMSLSSWDHLRPGRARVEAAYALWTQNPNLMIATLLFANTLASLGGPTMRPWQIRKRSRTRMMMTKAKWMTQRSRRPMPRRSPALANTGTIIAPSELMPFQIQLKNPMIRCRLL